jgi:phosphatidylserine/phosphatidylglycerophosphate/cardiolipin synthase-like enzyme
MKTSNIFKFSHQKYWIVDGHTVYLSTGNWDRSDFPYGSSWADYDRANRDMIVAMKNEALVKYYTEVFQYDYELAVEDSQS